MHPQNHPNPSLGELLVLPLPARPPWKLGVDLSRQFPLRAAQTELPAQTQSRADSQHVGCASQELGMQRTPRCCRDTQAGRISYRHTETHTPRLLGCWGCFLTPKLQFPSFWAHILPLPCCWGCFLTPRFQFPSLWAHISPLPFPLSSQEGISCSSYKSHLFYLPTPKGSPTSSSSSHQAVTTILRGFWVFFGSLLKHSWGEKQRSKNMNTKELN